MTVFSGKGVYGAIAIGKLSIFKKNDTTIKRMHVEDTEAEKARVEAAKAAACEQWQAIYEKALKEVGETNAQIFEIHIMMLEDEDYNESIANIIETQKVNAEYAVAVTADNFAEMFSSMDDAYMQARATDVKDISNRIIANLTGNISGADASEESMIICADDLPRVRGRDLLRRFRPRRRQGRVPQLRRDPRVRPRRPCGRRGREGRLSV